MGEDAPKFGAAFVEHPADGDHAGVIGAKARAVAVAIDFNQRGEGAPAERDASTTAAACSGESRTTARSQPVARSARTRLSFWGATPTA